MVFRYWWDEKIGARDLLQLDFFRVIERFGLKNLFSSLMINTINCRTRVAPLF